MLLLHDPIRQTDLPSGSVTTIGNFDGMHVGHQDLVRKVCARARELRVPSTVITFHPHPLSVVAPDRVPRQILTLSQKEELMASLGVDALVVVPFTHELAAWSAERFVRELLVDALHVREVHVGADFCFGAGREGTFAELQRLGQRYQFSVAEAGEVRVRGVRVSSSLVRAGIVKGAMRTTAAAIDRVYFIDGKVQTGRRLGRKIGFPTVNLSPSNDLFPGSGVYVTTCRFASFEKSFHSVTNIGVRPTLYENYATTIESHIFDFASDVYGDTVRMYFYRLIRRERQFRSALELTNQIRDDIVRSRAYFEKKGDSLATPDG